MLWFVPDDDWFCPNCNQAMLVEKFSEVLVSLAEELKWKAVEDKKLVFFFGLHMCLL